MILLSCVASPPSPDGPSFRTQRALADFANDLDGRLRSDPDYGGFYTEGDKAVFLFSRDWEARLRAVTSDPKAIARRADFDLARLRAAREAVEAEFESSKVPFRLITTDYRRNRVVVDGIDRRAWDEAVARRAIAKRPEAAYFFGNRDTVE